MGRNRYTVDEYQGHVELLLNQHGIEVEWKRGARPRAWRKGRRVRLSPVRTGISYADALHEIGHVVGRQTGRRLEREVQAWEWARANALEWTDTMARCAARCLGSYLRWYNRRFPSDPLGVGHPVRAWLEAS